MQKIFYVLAFLFGITAALAQDYQNANTTPVSCGAGPQPTVVVPFRIRNAITMTVPSGGTTVYVSSSSSMTTSTGFPIYGGASLTWQPYNGPVYCLVGSGTQNLNISETF